MLAQDHRGPGRLRELLAGTEPVVAPGAYDALSARLVAQAGFEAVYMTGFGASASLLGQPDVGLLSFAEMADQARRLAEAVDVPLIADADDGYGNPINVARTVRAMMTRSGERRASIAAGTFSTISPAALSCLPSRCPQRFGES